MAFAGSAAFGLVIGWFSVLVGRMSAGAVGLSLPGAVFAMVALVAATATAFAYVRYPGLLLTLIGFAAGVIAAAENLTRVSGSATGS